MNPAIRRTEIGLPGGRKVPYDCKRVNWITIYRVLCNGE